MDDMEEPAGWSSEETGGSYEFTDLALEELARLVLAERALIDGDRGIIISAGC